jgi:putative RNA 2'-phosphotransferase
MNKRLTKISKYLTFILRHEPQSIGLKRDADGWCSVEELVTKANSSGKSITMEQVRAVVAANEQQLFTLSDDGLLIRVRAVD